MAAVCTLCDLQNVVKILGLKFNTEYTDTKSLRYGHLMIMTDQDHDGSHIKGEISNTVTFPTPCGILGATV